MHPGPGGGSVRGLWQEGREGARWGIGLMATVQTHSPGPARSSRGHAGSPGSRLWLLLGTNATTSSACLFRPGGGDVFLCHLCQEPPHSCGPPAASLRVTLTNTRPCGLFPVGLCVPGACCSLRQRFVQTQVRREQRDSSGCKSQLVSLPPPPHPPPLSHFGLYASVSSSATAESRQTGRP